MSTIGGLSNLPQSPFFSFWPFLCMVYHLETMRLYGLRMGLGVRVGGCGPRGGPWEGAHSGVEASKHRFLPPGKAGI